MAIDVAVVTVVVFTVKVALVAPAGTVTLAATVPTAGLLLVRETRAPPLGAGALSMTVPAEGDPPTTLPGFSVSEVRVGPEGGVGVTVSEAVCWDAPDREAETLTWVELETEVVATRKVAIAVPAATVTLAGTVATDVLLLTSETVVPPGGAGALKAALPVEELPPLTLVGFRVREESVPEPGCTTVTFPLPPQEFVPRKSASRPSTAARPGRRRSSLRQSKSQASPPAKSQTHGTASSHGSRTLGPRRAGIMAARAVVCTVTVALVGLLPSSVTDPGVMTQVEAVGKPSQLNATVCVKPLLGVRVRV
jgi:hypothetical protein